MPRLAPVTRTTGRPAGVSSSVLLRDEVDVVRRVGLGRATAGRQLAAGPGAPRRTSAASCRPSTCRTVADQEALTRRAGARSERLDPGLGDRRPHGRLGGLRGWRQAGAAAVVLRSEQVAGEPAVRCSIQGRDGQPRVQPGQGDPPRQQDSRRREPVPAGVRGLPDLTRALGGASWASGRPKTAQQTSRRPLVQTSSSGRATRLEARDAGADGVEVARAPGLRNPCPAMHVATRHARTAARSDPGPLTPPRRTARDAAALSACRRAARIMARRPPAPPTCALSRRPSVGSRWLSTTASCPHGPGCSSATQQLAGAAEP